MRVSVIVPTLNRSSLLRKALESLCRQNFPANQYEIIVVDNGSTDATHEVVSSLIQRHLDHKIYWLYEPEAGLLAARHRGAREATGELLVFVDDDIEAAHDWLAAIVSGFDDINVQLIGGRSLPKYEVMPPTWIESFWDVAPYGGRSCYYLSLLDLGPNPLRISANYIWGLNFSIRRSKFYDLGGFHPDAVPDDLLRFRGDGECGLTTAAEARKEFAIYLPEATVYHFVPAKRVTPEYFERRAYLQGVSDSYSTVRRAGGLSNSLSAKARRLAGNLKRLWQPRVTSQQEVEAVRAIHMHVHRARQAGFEFHQRAIRADPSVLAWVLRPNYWNFRIPSVANEPRRRGENQERCETFHTPNHRGHEPRTP